MMTTNDPSALATQLERAAAALARCLADDVRIDPVHVLVPLMHSARLLEDIADELGRAAISVDESAAAAARRAGTEFAAAGRELGQVMVRLVRGDGPAPAPGGGPRHPRRGA